MVKAVHLTQQIHSSHAASSVKRKKPDDDDLSPSKKQRTRVSFSCGECHRRKQKCDRQIPCSHCVARKVPELCKAYTPGKAEQDLSVRISRLEHIIEMALPQYCTPETPRSSSLDAGPPNGRRRSVSIGEDDTHSPAEEHDPVGGTFQSGKWYGNSALGSVAPASVLEQLKNVGVPLDRRGVQGSSGPELDARNFDLLQGTSVTLGSSTRKPLVGDDLEPSAADNLKSLVQECGVAPHKISELLQELPPLRSSDVLIDYYFQAINWTRYPVSEHDFRTAYTAVCAHGRDGIGATNPNDVRFLPLLFVVLAIAVRLAPEHIAGDARCRRLTSLRYYWSSRRSLLIAAAIQPDSLDIVLTRLLSARFLTFDRRITECWSQLGAAVRTAQALGLHRDGSTMGMAPARVEYRRRIWSYLYHADRSYALVLGRPNSIQDDYTSTKTPANIDDDATTYRPESPPLSSPTRMTFVILRHQLARIIGRIVHHFQQVREKSSYSEVVALDDELLKFVSRLPPHFGLKPDKSLDETSQYIPVHRFLLITEILFVRISLHRPYLLRRLRTDRYARSRAACFESAVNDFEVRKAFRDAMAKETRESLSNAYREFQTAMISGIYLVLEPRGKDAPAMHAILDGFMEEHEGMREMDETTRRELKTIEFLRNKASQVEFQVQSPTESGPPDTSSDAHLLLGLHQGVPSSSSRSFPSLLNLSPSEAKSQSPSITFASAGPMAQSPTFQRLHQVSQGEHTSSPTASASPSADEESAAQSLLDHWCDTISNAPTDATTASMIWGGPGGADFSGWVGSTQTFAGPDPRLFDGLESSDWNYWEALVNQIQRGP